MRFLFTTLPGTSHVLPLVSLAQAAQAAGHDVLVAVSGSALPTASGAGLHTVATDENEAHRHYHKLADMLAEGGSGMEIGGKEMASFVGSVFADTGTAMVEGLLRIGQTWRPDVIVHTPPCLAGLVAARALGVPSVMHGLGTAMPIPRDALVHFAEEARRHGVHDLIDEVSDFEIDVSPPSLDAFSPPRSLARRATSLPMRFTAYTGGAQLPEWALEKGDRPRVVVTLGSFTRWFGDGALMREIVLGTVDLGVDLVVATAGAELPALPDPLPDHVTKIDWMPMRALLEHSDAVIHHGGLGTMYAAFAAGVPQLVLPVAAGPAAANARIAAARGVGFVLGIEEAKAPTVRTTVEELLKDPSLRENGQELAAEMATMPAPSTVVDRLEGLTTAYHRYTRPR